MVTKKDRWSWLKKFGYAFRGLYIALKEESSLVVHFIIATIILILAIVLELSAIEWSVIVLVICTIIGMELLNTAIENVVDIIIFEYNVKAKKIKDISAAATLILTIGAVTIGLIIFIPKIIALFN